jgi:hypothetical protein
MESAMVAGPEGIIVDLYHPFGDEDGPGRKSR